MDFSPARVEAAIIQLSSGNLAAISEVNSYLTAWSTSEHVHETALALMTNSQNTSVQITACLVLERSIVNNFMKFSGEYQAELRLLSLRIIGGFSVPEPLEGPICSLIGAIVFCSYPSTDEFLKTLISEPNQQTPALLIRRARILLSFLVRVNDKGVIPEVNTINLWTAVLELFAQSINFMTLMLEIEGAEVLGLKMIEQVSSFINAEEIIEFNLLPRCTQVANEHPELNDDVFDVLQGLFVEHSQNTDHFEMFGELIFEFFASRSSYSSTSVRVICLFIRKHWPIVITFLRFGCVELTETLKELTTNLSFLLTGKPLVAVPKIEPNIERRRELFYQVLHQLLASKPCDDSDTYWWSLWRDILRYYIGGLTGKDLSVSVEWLSDFIHEIFPVLIDNIDPTETTGLWRYETCSILLKSLFDTDFPRTVEFVKQCGSLKIFYVLGRIPTWSAPCTAFARTYLFQVLPQMNTEEEKLAVLCPLELKSGRFLPEERKTAISFATDCLTHASSEQLQGQAARTLYGIFNRCPSSISPDKFVPHAAEFMERFGDTAAEFMMKLCIGLLNLNGRDHSQIIPVIVSSLSTRPGVAFSLIRGDAYSMQFRRDLFAAVYQPLLTIINTSEDLAEEALFSLARLVGKIQLQGFEAQVDEIVQNLFSGSLPTDFGFEFFSSAYSYSGFLIERYSTFLNEQIANHPVSSVMFQMLHVYFDSVSFSFDVVADRLTEGIRDKRYDVCKEALSFAHLLLLQSDRDAYERVTLLYRDTVIRVVLETMLDGFHVNQFNRQAKVITSALARAIAMEGENTPFLRQFADICVETANVPEEAVTKLVTALATASRDTFLCMSIIAQFVMLAKKAPRSMAVSLYSALYEQALNDLSIFGSGTPITDIPEPEQPDSDDEAFCREMNELSVRRE